MRVREGTGTITGSHPHSRWSFCAQGHSILSQYQASYPAILDIATSLSLNKLLDNKRPMIHAQTCREEDHVHTTQSAIRRSLGAREDLQ